MSWVPFSPVFYFIYFTSFEKKKNMPVGSNQTHFINISDFCFFPFFFSSLPLLNIPLYPNPIIFEEQTLHRFKKKKWMSLLGMGERGNINLIILRLTCFFFFETEWGLIIVFFFPLIGWFCGHLINNPKMMEIGRYQKNMFFLCPRPLRHCTNLIFFFCLPFYIFFFVNYSFTWVLPKISGRRWANNNEISPFFPPAEMGVKYF